MEFGLMPIACSHIILLMMTGFKIINVHDTPHNHALLNGVQKCRLYINNVAVFLFVSLCFVWFFFNFVIFQNFVCCVLGFFLVSYERKFWINWQICLITEFFYLTVHALSTTVVQSVLFIMTGMYGELEQIGVTVCLLISIQVYYGIHHLEMSFKVLKTLHFICNFYK